MPAKLETQFALSALPPAMRDQATVYLLDLNKGYQLFRQGTSGVTCLVERTAWEQAEFRNDIYVPLCYDAAGSKTFLKVIMDAAALLIQGTGPVALRTELLGGHRKEEEHMCPVCVANTAVMVAGAGFTGGILAVCIGKVRKFFRTRGLGLFQRTKEK